MKTKSTAKNTASSPATRPKRTRSASLKVGKLAAESNLEPAPVYLSDTRRVPSSSSTIVEAKIDVGFGNQLFIRGEGQGLSWTKGEALNCIDGQTWRWTNHGDEIVIFKLLINDQQWAQGENVEVLPGETAELTPIF